MNKNLIVYIHGFDKDYDGYFMPELKRLVEVVVPNAADQNLTTVKQPRFDSRNYSFAQCAQRLVGDLSNEGPYNKKFAICHSMGGLIARQMETYGFGFDGVLTINSPHEGTAAWTNVGSWALGDGPKSLLPISKDLELLNKRDVICRKHYHFVGVKCYGISGAITGLPLPDEHRNDTLVELASQLGTGLEGGISQYELRLDYHLRFVPQAVLGTPNNPHTFVIEHPFGDTDYPSFDNGPLKEAIKNCIKI